MFSILYDFSLMLFGSASLAFQRFFRKKYKKALFEKLGWKLPPALHKGNELSFWIHSVSLGETKAAKGFVQKLRVKFPNAKIIHTTMTQTGLKEAESNPNVDCAFYLPLDTSWTMKRLVQRFAPDYVFLIENDLWINFLKEAKSQGAKIYWLSAKISERSFRRYQQFSFYSKRVFALFDHVFAQDQIYEQRLLHFLKNDKVSVGGDLKFDASVASFDQAHINSWKQKLGIHSSDFVITIACTHNPEEKKILETLLPLQELHPNLKIFLAPRHPERFKEVEKLLEKHPISHSTYSKLPKISPENRIVLIDTMGFLPICYQISQLAVVGGSFEKGIGGHNILEPCQFYTPVIFGPFMESQKYLKEKVLSAEAGEMVSIENFKDHILHYLEHPEALKIKQTHTKALVKSLRGSLNRTWQGVFSDSH